MDENTYRLSSFYIGADLEVLAKVTADDLELLLGMKCFIIMPSSDIVFYDLLLKEFQLAR